MMQLFERLHLAHQFGANRGQNREQLDNLWGELRRIDVTRPLYTLYAERIAATRGHPIDSSWDGITHFETRQT